MTDEKKTLRGGLTPEQKNTALDEDTLEAVSGGMTSMGWAERSWDRLKEILGANDDKEQKP